MTTLTTVTRTGLHTEALDHVFTIGASGTDHYTFQGEGLNGTVNDPTLYLTRGKTYRFEKGSAHPLRIQSTAGASGTAYNTGVTNNGGTGTVIVEVQHDAPDVLYYQCTSHANMNGILYITGALADGGVTTAKIADDAVTSAKIASSSVTNDSIANNSITGDKITAGTITTTKIADSQITTAKINDGAVTGAKLGDLSVSSGKIVSGAITSTKIADGNVSTAKIGDQAVTLAKLPHGTSSNDGKFLRANNGADPTFETVNTDLVSDTSPQLGGSLDVNDYNILNGTAILDITESQRFEFNIGGTEYLDVNGGGIDVTGNIDVSGNIKIADALEHKNDSNTKIRFPSDDEVTVETNGQERFRVTQAGDVRLLSQNGVGGNDTNVLYWRGGNGTQFANLARIYSRGVSNWGGELYLQVKDDDGSLSNNYRTGIKIDSNGQVTKPLTCSYFAYSTTTQNHSNSAFINPGGWDVSNVGRHNIGSHFNTSNTTFTAPVAGRYLVSMQYSFWYGSDNSSTDGHQLRLQINNAGANEYFLQGGLANGAEGLVIGQAIVNLAANDTVRWKHDGYGGTGYYNIFTTFGYLLG